MKSACVSGRERKRDSEGIGERDEEKGRRERGLKLEGNHDAL